VLGRSAAAAALLLRPAGRRGARNGQSRWARRIWAVTLPPMKPGELLSASRCKEVEQQSYLGPLVNLWQPQVEDVLSC